MGKKRAVLEDVQNVCSKLHQVENPNLTKSASKPPPDASSVLAELELEGESQKGTIHKFTFVYDYS
eukprot:7392327-Pyramimonas_sp.AAC.1